MCKRTFAQHVGITAIIMILFFLLSNTLQAEERRQENAHVHGIAHLNLVLDKNELFIEFESPAVDIVGFEHTPETDEEKRTFQKALGLLRAGKRMFTFPKEAGVKLEKSVVKSVVHHDCDHEHHDEEADGEHSDIFIEYTFHCENPGELKTIEVMLFKRFNSLQKIRVQSLSPSQQTFVELSPDNNTLQF